MYKMPLILTLTSFQIQDKVTKNLVFLHTLHKTGDTLCARLSPNRFTYLVSINGMIIVDVQDTFHFDLDLISDPGQGHKNLSFSACFI